MAKSKWLKQYEADFRLQRRTAVLLITALEKHKARLRAGEVAFDREEYRVYWQPVQTHLRLLDRFEDMNISCLSGLAPEKYRRRYRPQLQREIA